LVVGIYQVQSICNVMDEYCKAWFSLAITAKASDKSLMLACSGDGGCPVDTA